MGATEVTAAEDAPKRIWNSLEVSKLIMSAATPLMIFAMGSFLSYQATRQANAREAAEKKAQIAREAADKRAQEARNAADKLAAAKRDDDLTKAAALREKQGREETARFQVALQAAEDRRDDAIRMSTIERERVLRDSELRSGRLAALYQKRIAVWDEIGPKLSALRVDLRWIIYPGPGKPSTLQDLPHRDLPGLLREIETTFLANDFYFSGQFGKHLLSFLQRQDVVIKVVTDTSMAPDERYKALSQDSNLEKEDAFWIDTCIGDELGTNEYHTEGC